MASLLDNVLVFGRLLRALGLEVHVGRLLDLAEALQHVDIGARDDVYHACRALLVHRREDLGIFDRAFDAFWRVHDTDPATGSRRLARERPIADRPADQGRPVEMPGVSMDDTLIDAPSGVVQTWSDARALAHKDFAEFTADEMALARAALDRLTWTPGERRTRRWIRGRGPRVDLRGALALSIRTGGHVVVLPRRRRRVRPRALVLICDISGSMDRYARVLLQFVHAVGRRNRRVEAFVFSTDLTRVTREIRSAKLDRAVAEVAKAVPDWSGGTRIGEALRRLRVTWRRRALHGRPVVLLVSDGWDRGDPAVLRDEVARLQRDSHRLIWLNPLIGSVDYAPLTRGLQAALPFVDDLLPVRTLANLADLALHLNQLPRRR